MSGKKYLLDTNIVVDIFSGSPKVNSLLKTLSEPIISVITIGELNYGAEKSQNKAKHLKQIHEFIDICTILNIDITTSKIYGTIKNELKKKGRPIPENDLWIASTSIQHNLSLITNDKHFDIIDNLNLLDISRYF